jgi:proteic killer suppression protein
VIRSYADDDRRRLFEDEDVRRFRAIERQARRKLLLLNTAMSLDDLRVPPGNRLEALAGDRAGQHSIRINRQWRICFRWQNRDAYDARSWTITEDKDHPRPHRRGLKDHGSVS